MNAIRQEFERFRQAERGEGEKIGRQEGIAGSILFVLTTRGLAVSEKAQKVILSCQDPMLLHTWLGRALTAKSIEEVLDPTG